MSNNRTRYRQAFLNAMRQSRAYRDSVPIIARSLQVQALCALDQLRADERGMLNPDHTPEQALKAINWKILQHHMGNHSFAVIRLPERLQRERVYGGAR